MCEFILQISIKADLQDFFLKISTLFNVTSL